MTTGNGKNTLEKTGPQKNWSRKKRWTTLSLADSGFLDQVQWAEPGQGRGSWFWWHKGLDSTSPHVGVSFLNQVLTGNFCFDFLRARRLVMYNKMFDPEGNFYGFLIFFVNKKKKSRSRSLLEQTWHRNNAITRTRTFRTINFKRCSKHSY